MRTFQVSEGQVKPLGTNQRRFLLAERFGNARYMISFVHRVEGDLDLVRMRGAAEALVLRHQALRSSFRLVDAEYVAVLAAQPAFAFHVIDVADASFDTFRDAALPLVMEGISLGHAETLVRFIIAGTPDRHQWRVCFAAHHAIADGMSGALAMEELFALYDGATLPPCSSYYDYRADPAVATLHEDYWTDRLLHVPLEVTAPPDVEPGAAAHVGVFVHNQIDLDPKTFRDLIAGTGASKFGCLAAAYALGLMRITGEPEVLFAFQSAGRHTANAPATVFGPFSNTLVLMACPLDFPTFGALARSLTAQTRLAVQHEGVPFDRLAPLLPSGLAFSLNAFPKELAPQARGLVVSPREFLDRQTEFALNLRWSQDGEANVMRGFYDAGRFSAARIEDFLRAQKRILQAGLDDPDSTPARLLADLSGTAQPLPARWQTPPAQNVIDLFLARAAEAPDASAIISADRTLSYDALVSLSDRYAASFGDAGARPGDRVVILADRSVDLVAAVIGSARAGVGLAVLDASYPEDRLRQQIDLLRPRFALCLVKDTEGWVAAIPGLTVLKMASEGTHPSSLPDMRSMYYLFTSGTTGTPKCVGHGFEVLTFYVQWAMQTFDVTPDDCITLMSGLNHDPVMRDIFLPLAAGATLIIPTDADMSVPARLRRFLAHTEASILHLTPPLGRLLAMGAQDGDLATARLFVWGGDELPGAQVRQFRSLAPGAEHVNLYGASETPQAAAIYRIPVNHPATWRSTPIGTSVDWMRCNCITPDGRICGPGEIGELQVAMPFAVTILSPDGTSEQKTLHRTGDRAFIMPDNEMVFVGRRDDQIKIRGFRVELGDVTAVLRSMPGVRQCLTLAESKNDGSLRLAAWCEADTAKLTVADLRQALRQRLPDHMIPERLAVIERMPLLANGKIDRAALRTLVGPTPTVRSDKAPLATEAERRIAAIFARASGSRVVDTNLSLVDLGADSLSVIGARLGLEEMGVDVPDSWEDLTISELALLVPQDPSRRQNWLRAARIETFIAIRSVAIFLVVALHMHWFGYGGGATDLLFVIAGLAFATYLARPIVAQGQTRQVWTLLGKIILIGYPVMLLIYGSQLLLGKPAHLSTILFYSNMISHDPSAPDDGRVVWLWYIHSYFQVFLAIAVMLSIPWVLALFRRYSFRATVAAMLIAMAGFVLLSLWGGAWTSPIVALSPLPLSPLKAFVLVCIGVALGFADTTPRQVIVISCAGLWAAVSLALFQSPHVTILLVGVAVLLLVPSLRLPALVVRGITIVSGASFFIYLMHNPMAFVAGRVVPITLHPAILTIGSILLSILLWKAWQPVIRWVFAQKDAPQKLAETEPG